MEKNKESSKFDTYLTKFLTELKKTFPEYKEKINEFEAKNDSDISKNYSELIKPHYKKFINKDISILSEINFIDDVKFEKLFTLNITNKTKNIIWKYLYNLFILCIAEHEVENLASYVIQNSNLDDDSNGNLNAGESPAQLPNIGDLFKNLSKDPKKIEDSMKPLQAELEKTHIGKIAQDIVGELNINNEEGGGFESMLNLFSNDSNGENLFSKISNKITNSLSDGNISQQDLINEAQNMASKLQDTNLFGNLFGDLNKKLPKQTNDNKKSSKIRKRLQNKLKKKNQKK